MQTKILKCVNAASQFLQAKDVDILKASTLLQNTISVVKHSLNNQSQNSCHFDERSEDSRLADAESNLRVYVSNACLNIIIQQLSQRFNRCLFEIMFANM